MTERELGCIKLGLVEPCTLNCDLVSSALSTQPDMDIVFTSSGVGDLPNNAGSRDIRLLLLSVSFRGVMTPPAMLLEGWRRIFPFAHFVVISDCRVYTTITSLIRWGIDGYLIWDTIHLADMVDSIRAVNEGSLVVCPVAKEIIYHDSFSAPRLTATELEVVNALACSQEYSRKEAATLLGMCYKTFNVHMRNIAVKLEMCGGAQSIVMRCRELGLVDDAHC